MISSDDIGFEDSPAMLRLMSFPVADKASSTSLAPAPITVGQQAGVKGRTNTQTHRRMGEIGNGRKRAIATEEVFELQHGRTSSMGVAIGGEQRRISKQHFGLRFKGEGEPVGVRLHDSDIRAARRKERRKTEYGEWRHWRSRERKGGSFIPPGRRDGGLGPCELALVGVGWAGEGARPLGRVVQLGGGSRWQTGRQAATVAAEEPGRKVFFGHFLAHRSTVNSN
ncbi:hypothetical protein HPP92_001689 [Vanilla planifolia]|uniref:Uncharacterized protein n=1 Tax=Vanilla planifolia TaxID=51239 RepID=A0A835SDC0_VANPL|nr:hypothetical protein HPP92_001689 [Vanilla planifolia]